MEKMYCFTCDKEVYGNVRVEKTKYNVHGRDVYVDDHVFTCPNCKTEYNFDSVDEGLYKVYDAYLNLYGLSFKKLKEIRESLNLSQELFATVLGWSKKTITRYENAESLPQKEYLDTYINLTRDKNYIYYILKNNNSLTKKEYYKILDKINVDIDYKSINVVLYILNNGKLNRTQLMKHLFGVDFESYKLNNITISSFRYANAPFGPIVNNQDTLINFLIKNDYISVESSKDDTFMLFVPSQKADLSCFNDDEIQVLDKIISTFKNKSAKELSDWSHGFKGWIDTKNGEIISFEYAKYLEI